MISFIPGYFGWLGNQMFQYAATFAASKRVKTECGFPENKPNLFDLFTLSAKKQEVPLHYMYQEPHFEYSEIPDYITELTISGYFQSEKYFEDYAEELRSEFTFKDSVPKVDKGTVAVHVRRGDYTDLQDHHPLCTLEYYRAAMEKFPGHNFLIFSDDIDWCKHNIKGDNVSYSEGYTAEQDLQRMSLCDHQIIANSSFSWWGAWLNNNPDKKIIAPKQWFGPAKPLETKDIYCKDWIIL
jgi:hypothetical protein